jgi:hypothetical protein
MGAVARVVELVPVEDEPAEDEPTTIAESLDDLEDAARAGKVYFADVAMQLALTRHLAAVVQAIRLGTEPTIAQVHAIRELRLAMTELRELVIGYARRR